VRGGEENAVPAQVGAMAFLGSFFRADLVGAGPGEVRLRADLSVDLVRRLGLAEGQTLSVVLPRERLRVYPQAPRAA
jgi:iron(III) transport system ATP-binding protein